MPTRQRPTLPPVNDAPRTHLLAMRLTEDERTALEGAASLDGQPCSTYIRTVALKAAAKRLARAA